MSRRNWVYLLACFGALLSMQSLGWMRTYAVTACGLLITVALLSGGANDKGE